MIAKRGLDSHRSAYELISRAWTLMLPRAWSSTYTAWNCVLPARACTSRKRWSSWHALSSVAARSLPVLRCPIQAASAWFWLMAIGASPRCADWGAIPPKSSAGLVIWPRGSSTCCAVPRGALLPPSKRRCRCASSSKVWACRSMSWPAAADAMSVGSIGGCNCSRGCPIRCWMPCARVSYRLGPPAGYSPRWRAPTPSMRSNCSARCAPPRCPHASCGCGSSTTKVLRAPSANIWWHTRACSSMRCKRKASSVLWSVCARGPKANARPTCASSKRSLRGCVNAYRCSLPRPCLRRWHAALRICTTH